LNPFEGDDLAFAFGAGTEYELSSSLTLEFEWLWRYFMTEDEKLWPDVDGMWSNTHAWSLSAGVTYGF
jgi:opacity protein-like surface antigen